MSTPIIINEDDSDVIVVIIDEPPAPEVVTEDDLDIIALVEGTPGPAGPEGPQGEQGIQGEKGDPGDAVAGVTPPLTFDPDTGIVGIDTTSFQISALSYRHNQVSAQTTWSITHNLGVYPEVVVVDSAGTRVYGDINYVDTNSLTLQFSAAFSGTAYLI